MPKLPFDRTVLFNAKGLTSRQVSSPATPPPQSPDEIPEFSGSTAGFVSLFVFLAIIIIFSTVGVFILLRAPKPDPYERHARRVLSGRREDTMYEMPLGPPGLKEKVKNLFRFNRKRDGWVRANDGDADEWDASDRLAMASDPPNGRRPRGERWSPDDSSKSAEHAYGDSKVFKSDTLESIELSVPEPLSIDPGVTLPHLSYDDPYSTSPTIIEHSERTHHGTRSDPLGERTAEETPMRVFENGTRFKESL